MCSNQVKNTPHDPRNWPNGHRTCFRGIMAQVQLNMAILDVFNCFWSFFLLNHWPIPVVYIVSHCSLMLRPLPFVLVYFCSFIFSLVRVSFHYSTVMCTSASTSTYSYVQTTHVSRLLYSLPVGHKTGTRRDQVKNTRLPPHNYSSGALAP